MSGAERRNAAIEPSGHERSTASDGSGPSDSDEDTATAPVLEFQEPDLATDDDDDRARGFDPYNSGSFVLTRKPR